METCAEAGGRAAQAGQFREHLSGQFIQVIGAAVGQRALGLVPDALVGVEFRSVTGEKCDVKTSMPFQEAANLIPFVNLPVIPEQDDRAGQMPEQVAQKEADFRAADVRPMQLIVEGDPMAFRTDRQGGDQRHLAMLIAISRQGCPAPRRPRAAHGAEQEEARFVKEDEVGAQLQSPFFMRGHSSRFHCSIRSSLRSKARRSGFWQLHFKRWRSRPT